MLNMTYAKEMCVRLVFSNIRRRNKIGPGNNLGGCKEGEGGAENQKSEQKMSGTSKKKRENNTKQALKTKKGAENVRNEQRKQKRRTEKEQKTSRSRGLVSTTSE